jgi:hypothetical protein
MPVTDEVAYAQPPVEGEAPFAGPPPIEEVSYTPAPPVTGEIPDVSVEPLQQAIPDMEAAPPQEAVPSFESLVSPHAEAPPETPTFASEDADYSAQPTSGEFFSPLAAPETVGEGVLPILEPESEPPPAQGGTVPDMPPPVYDVPDMPPPTVPAYGADAYEGAEYGAAAQAYSPDEFAKPYGWEGAGANALAAASGETVQTGYSPEAYVPTAPTLPDGTEAEMTSAVFSEFTSLATERPKVQRTKAGLQRRAKPPETEPEEIPVPPAPAEAEVKPVARDPEAVRSSFSNFHSATSRARDSEGEGSDVHSAEPNEMTP